MSTVKIYGIKNCSTVKKTFDWLDEHSIAYEFHDYKKQGIDITAFKQAITEHGWETVINRRGTTWRKLPDNVKENMNDKNAVNIAAENPSIIKRPLLMKDNETHLGFSEEDYKSIFA